MDNFDNYKSLSSEYKLPQDETNVKERWYQSPYGNPYELNNPSLSGEGPVFGPKQSIGGWLKTTTFWLILAVVLAIIIMALYMRYRSA